MSQKQFLKYQGDFIKHAESFITKLKRKNEIRQELKNFCEEHLVNLTDYSTFSFQDHSFTVVIDVNEFKLWDDIKDDILTFVEFVGEYYNLSNIEFDLMSWVYSDYNYVFDGILSKQTVNTNEILNNRFFTNEEIFRIKLNFNICL